ncbi:M20/M25/M40 family metallo-hydrolase [Daejeonella sp. H1SJ63]|uniref:M20/M25/M40 family metallo-hydrolase n=1 Tax=Daejeonella sp. H1SJ63 TaxID=3034145 RepID=UPI0023ED9F95|nr:M20/M25/M40 family metallo-hydrolase [Daejeonella sp. H1SJ63]
MKKVLAGFITILFVTAVYAQKPGQIIKQADVARIIKTLSSDEMEGRGTFNPGIDRAAKFIENEFKQIGLKPLAGDNDFRQDFMVRRIKPEAIQATINGKTIDQQNVLLISDLPSSDFDQSSGNKVILIASGDQFIQKYREITAMKSPVLVLVDNQHAQMFKRLKDNSSRGRIVEKQNQTAAAVFILGESDAASYKVSFSNKIEELPLFNVAGMLPGSSKAKELVLISAHYDHLGIVEEVDGDAIANGADDDASGTTAVISLAKYYKKLNNNERTLIFVAFTAEEVGGFGARHFSSLLNPDDVAAMFNIEMIGKESKFGKNAAFITGYERSDFGEILQKNLVGTDFKFHPDPYPTQNLFYRSDNATLAALGVPAHTISTDQIDTDKFYHTVNDEFETLEVANIHATIKAIALSARSIVAGKDTPKRIPKLNSRP